MQEITRNKKNTKVKFWVYISSVRSQILVFLLYPIFHPNHLHISTGQQSNTQLSNFSCSRCPNHLNLHASSRQPQIEIPGDKKAKVKCIIQCPASILSSIRVFEGRF